MACDEYALLSAMWRAMDTNFVMDRGYLCQNLNPRRSMQLDANLVVGRIEANKGVYIKIVHKYMIHVDVPV